VLIMTDTREFESFTTTPNTANNINTNDGKQLLLVQSCHIG